MRQGSSSDTRRLEQFSREDRYHERTGRTVICDIYKGPLVDGTESPGYIESMTRDRRPACYVAPRVALQKRNIRGQVVDSVGGIPADGLAAAARWAGENVRLVHVNHLGLSYDEIMKNYVVKVDFPFYKAKYGVLLRRPGLSSSQASVPDGDTADDIIKARMINQDVPTLEKMRMARGRYGLAGGTVNGVPFSGSQEKFPRKGDCWL